MIDRDDLLHAAALAQADHPGELEYLFAEKMLAAVEPLIRAEERESLREKVEADRADLNAKIDRAHLAWPIDHEQVDAWACERLALNRVLALLKEASDA